jgi:hypothetical protein
MVPLNLPGKPTRWGCRAWGNVNINDYNDWPTEFREPNNMKMKRGKS